MVRCCLDFVCRPKPWVCSDLVRPSPTTPRTTERSPSHIWIISGDMQPCHRTVKHSSSVNDYPFQVWYEDGWGARHPSEFVPENGTNTGFKHWFTILIPQRTKPLSAAKSENHPKSSTPMWGSNAICVEEGVDGEERVFYVQAGNDGNDGNDDGWWRMMTDVVERNDGTSWTDVDRRGDLQHATTRSRQVTNEATETLEAEGKAEMVWVPGARRGKERQGDKHKDKVNQKTLQEIQRKFFVRHCIHLIHLACGSYQFTYQSYMFIAFTLSTWIVYWFFNIQRFNWFKNVLKFRRFFVALKLPRERSPEATPVACISLADLLEVGKFGKGHCQHCGVLIQQFQQFVRQTSSSEMVQFGRHHAICPWDACWTRRRQEIYKNRRQFCRVRTREECSIDSMNSSTGQT